MNAGHTLERLWGALPGPAAWYGPEDERGWAEVTRVLREGGWAYLVRGDAEALSGATVLMVVEREDDLLPVLPEGLMLAALRGGPPENAGELVIIDGARPFGALPMS